MLVGTKPNLKNPKLEGVKGQRRVCGNEAACVEQRVVALVALERIHPFRQVERGARKEDGVFHEAALVRVGRRAHRAETETCRRAHAGRDVSSAHIW